MNPIQAECVQIQRDYLNSSSAATSGSLDNALIMARWGKNCQAAYGDFQPGAPYDQVAPLFTVPAPVNNNSPASGTIQDIPDLSAGEGTAKPMANGYAIGPIISHDRSCNTLWMQLKKMADGAPKNANIAIFQSTCGIAYDPNKGPVYDTTASDGPPPVIQTPVFIPGGGTHSVDTTSRHTFGTFGRAQAGAHSRPDLEHQKYLQAKAEHDAICTDLTSRYLSAFHPNGSYDRHLADDIKKQLQNRECGVPANPPVNCDASVQETAYHDSLEAELIGRPFGKLIEHPLVGSIAGATGAIGTTIVVTVFAPELVISRYVRVGVMSAGGYAGLYLNGVFWGVLEDNLISKIGNFLLNYSPLALLGKGEEWLLQKAFGNKWGHILGKANVLNFIRGTNTGAAYDAAKCKMKCNSHTGISRDMCKLGARIGL